MADIIRKVIIPKNSLPPVGANNAHTFRYRVVSEDGNRSSAWSPIYAVTGQTYGEGSSTGSVHAVNDSIMLSTWTPVDGVSGYDIFLSFTDAQSVGPGYVYSGSASVNSYSFIKPELTNGHQTKHVKVLVQISSQEKVVSEVLKIWESLETSI